MDGSSPFEPCPLSRRQLFWNLAANDHLDREKQPKGSKNMLGIFALLQSFAFAISLLCLPTLKLKIDGKVVLFTFRTTPCYTRVDVLETGDVPILFSFLQVEKFG